MYIFGSVEIEIGNTFNDGNEWHKKTEVIPYNEYDKKKNLNNNKQNA